TQLYRAGEGAIAWKRHICDVADELELALVMGDMDEAGRYANLLVGAGPGLTPASDDVLVGMLAGLESIARRLGKKPALPKVQKGRTTRLSDTLLEQAARGSAIEPLLDVVHTMGSPLFGQTQIRSLLAVGHTSGAAMLAGVGLAGRVMLKRWGETWSVAG
ncbi:MAG: DUF2877 domain-containing protein, partial [Chloroflexota bacterium]